MACPSCGHLDAGEFLGMPRVPVLCNVLLHARDEAISAPTAEISLSFCRPSSGGCGLVFNDAFKPELMRYTGQYENALHFSATFQKYADDLARSLVERHSLRGRRIIELGCGDGQFLAMLCRLGSNSGLGFDPAHDPSRSREQVDASPGSIDIISEYYGPAHAHHTADFIACRHVLEHIPRPDEFLRSIRRTIGDQRDTVVFFEVPNALWTIEQMGIWDIIYEHVLYFTPPSLSRAFSNAGLIPLRTDTVYSGQFLTIEARPGDVPAGFAAGLDHEQRRIEGLVDRFSERYREKLTQWVGVLDNLRRSSRRGVLWGAGSKGVTFLNVAAGPADQDNPFQHIVDINPRKHGCFVAGTGQQIVAPEALREIRPAVVVIMNPAYRDEIASQLRSLGVDAEVMVA
ncbi:MAG: methyltransferase domain-containing protein [Phycisphaeraceae bacterium]|nr:methyltransferase domain-containing protein [Phycisphaeraceae bacterium]